MGLTFTGVIRSPIARLLAVCCVVVVLVAACGDTRPPPTVVPPAGETATPESTPTSAPAPTATPAVEPSSLDRAALEAFYESTGGEKWTRSDNWLSDSPTGEWYGVTTDDDGRVTQLVLVENGLVGNIPPEFGDLSNMERLELRGNWLVDLIPSELGSLSNLTVLDLSENRLVGEIPAELGSLANSLEVLGSLEQLD